MRVFTLVAFVLAMAAIVLSAGPASAASGRYIVVLEDSSSLTPAAAADQARRAGADVTNVYTRAVRGYAATLPASLLDRLRASREIAIVERVRTLRLEATQTNPPSWGLDRSDQRTRPLNQAYTYAATGSGVNAYVVDSGVNLNHQDFAGRTRAGYDAVDGALPAADCNGHGTHVAGTIGGTAYGIAKGVTIVPVRAGDCNGSLATNDILEAFDWIIADHAAGTPGVANMSFGTTAGTSSVIDAGTNNVIGDGVSVAVAAGNGVGNGLYPQNACDTSPARVPAALTVSNTNSSDTKTFEANYGTCVDLFAPGASIVSASHTSNTGSSTKSGTSMSSPHVAGTAALYLEGNRSASPATVAAAIVNNATTGVVQSPGSGSPNRLLYTGFITGGGGSNQAPAASFTSSCNGLTCTFTDGSTDADGTIASRSWDFGDGGTSTATNPSHTYATAGTYTVTLTVTDNAGASSSTTRSVTVTSGGTGDPDPATPTLTSGVTATGTNAAAGGWVYYKIQVPAGRSQLRVDLTGPSCGLLSCNPDLDLFLRRAAKPTTTLKDGSSETGSNAETVTISSPAADWWYIGVYTYSGSAGSSFSVKATVS